MFVDNPPFPVDNFSCLGITWGLYNHREPITLPIAIPPPSPPSNTHFLPYPLDRNRA